MAADREARKRRRPKTCSRALQLAVASYHNNIPAPEDRIETGDLPVLTYVMVDAATSRAPLTVLQVDLPNKAAEAFAVTELLEAVLLLLPRKEVLLCQRVNQTWKDAVQGSIKLQRDLYLAPEKDSGVVALMSCTPWAELQVSTYVQRDGPEAQVSETLCQLVVANPLLFFNTDLHNRGETLGSPSTYFADLLAHSRLPFHNIDLLVGLFSGSRSDPACLEMFVTQPPVYEVNVELNILDCSGCKGKETCCFDLCHVTNSKGLRVRDIFAAARSFHSGQSALREDEEQDAVTSISIGFEAVAQGSRKGIILVTAEDMCLAKLEAMRPRLPVEADIVEVAQDEQ